MRTNIANTESNVNESITVLGHVQLFFEIFAIIYFSEILHSKHQ